MKTAALAFPTPEDDIPNILHAVRTHLGMQVGFVSRFHCGQRYFLHVSADHNAPIQEGMGDPLEESYCQRIVDGRLPQLMTDARLHPESAAMAVTHELPVGAHLSVPLVLQDGEIYGTFCCFSHHAEPNLNNRDLQVLRAFAELARDRIEHQRQAQQHFDLRKKRIEQVLFEQHYRMVFQPIVHLTSGEMVGVEALSRFTLPPQQTPDVWFKEAREVQLGTELELAVCLRALHDFQHLPEGVFLAVNFSPEVLLDPRTHEVLLHAPLGQMVLEITEHDRIPDYPELQACLQAFREQGLKLAIDDAGAGYASMQHVLQMQPDTLKLDIALTRGIDQSRQKQALTSALVTYAQQMDTDVIAEGIETTEELHTLQKLGVVYGQGYLLGRPQPIQDLLQTHMTK